jgi:hypothetical protein
MFAHTFRISLTIYVTTESAHIQFNLREFRENMHREGRTFHMGVNKITFSRVE